jgi:hypothetical protein
LSARKNKGRIPQGEEKLERKKMGRRLDLILRKNKLELGLVKPEDVPTIMIASYLEKETSSFRRH